mmetsp:Transcript_7824/g.12731  ORF Transcript_7824/g.12731 Transcript_7824/m.12731 type:complete len:99 (+) Transcript_7824:2234-2530(+)
MEHPNAQDLWHRVQALAFNAWILKTAAMFNSRQAVIFFWDPLLSVLVMNDNSDLCTISSKFTVSWLACLRFPKKIAPPPPLSPAQLTACAMPSGSSND